MIEKEKGPYGIMVGDSFHWIGPYKHDGLVIADYNNFYIDVQEVGADYIKVDWREAVASTRIDGIEKESAVKVIPKEILYEIIERYDLEPNNEQTQKRFPDGL